jgi:hypothetical protein
MAPPFLTAFPLGSLKNLPLLAWLSIPAGNYGHSETMRFLKSASPPCQRCFTEFVPRSSGNPLRLSTYLSKFVSLIWQEATHLHASTELQCPVDFAAGLEGSSNRIHGGSLSGF